MSTATVIINNLQEVPVSIAFVNAAGQPSPVTGIAIAVTDSTIIKLGGPAIDPTIPTASVAVVVSAVGPVGSASLTATGINPDGTPVTGTLEFNVTEAGASAVVFEVGTPVLIPAP